MTTPAAREDLVTIEQAASLIGKSSETVRRYLPSDDNRTAKSVRLPHAQQESTEPNAPWLIPVADLVAAGLLADDAHVSGVGPAEGQQALARQRDDRELIRLREQLAAYKASERAKDMLLAERGRELVRLRRTCAELHKTLNLALGAGGAATGMAA